MFIDICIIGNQLPLTKLRRSLRAVQSLTINFWRIILRRIKTRSSTMIAALACGLGLSVAGVPNEAVAQSAKTAQAAWASRCYKSKKGKLLGCRLVQRIYIKQQGRNQLLVAIQLRRPKGAKPYIYLRLPLGLALPIGVSLDVINDKTKKSHLTQRAPLQTCDKRGCYANLPLEAKLLAAMKSANTMRVVFQSNRNKRFNIVITLKGLTKAYDKLTVKLK